MAAPFAKWVTGVIPTLLANEVIMNCMVCNKLLEPSRQRLCETCKEESRQEVVKQLGGEEQYKKLLCWPKDGKKEERK